MYNPVSILKTDEGAGCPRPKNPTIILVPVEFVAAEPTREIGDIVMKSDLELIAEKKIVKEGYRKVVVYMLAKESRDE